MLGFHIEARCRGKNALSYLVSFNMGENMNILHIINIYLNSEVVLKLAHKW